MKVLLTGGNGQLGSSIQDLLPKDIDLFVTTREKHDLTDMKSCKNLIKEVRPDWLINTAAYTSVDKAEKDYKIAFEINANTPKVLAEALSETGGRLLQISTDYVFNGKKNQPYSVDDHIDPINVYGLSKASGENAIESILGNKGKSIILRSSWIIGPNGNNFAKTMLKLHSENEQIKVIDDQIGSPTSTITLGNTCWEIIKASSENIKINPKHKILHWCDSGIASWYDLSVAVGEIGLELGLIKKNAQVIPIKTNEYNSLARRPQYSVLDNSIIKKDFGLTSTHWRTSLKHILRLIKKHKENVEH